MVIIGVLKDLPGTAAYTDRLLKNYEDMEDALKPYYGDAAEKLGDLIQDHLLIAVDILNAAKAGDMAAFTAAKTRWYQNAAQIAQLMSQLNPQFWPQAETQQMWDDHLAEAVAVLTDSFTADVAAYDKVHDLALEMADFFSQGVIKQFPNAFGARSTLTQ